MVKKKPNRGSPAWLHKELQRQTFRLIESELRMYHQTKAQLERLREDIIQSADYSNDIPRVDGGGSNSDPTASKTVKLMTSAEILELTRRIGAIESAIEETRARDPHRLELIRLKYWEPGLSDTAIWMRLNVDRDTFYRWRREFVWLVAEKLGWDAGQRREPKRKRASSC